VGNEGKEGGAGQEWKRVEKTRSRLARGKINFKSSRSKIKKKKEDVESWKKRPDQGEFWGKKKGTVPGS